MSKTGQFLLLAIVLYSAAVQSVKLETSQQQAEFKQQLLKHAIAFAPDKFPFKRLDQWIDDKQIVLLGDGTHGSREFYQYRAQISQHLIVNHGFSAVIVEGNWPAGQQVNQYINNMAGDSTTLALSGFKKYFPWVWRNQSMAKFVQWLYDYNQVSLHKNVSFYGMDLFSLNASITRNLELLNNHNIPFSSQLTTLYQCFSAYKNNALVYGQRVSANPQQSCQSQAQQQFNIITEQPYLLKDQTEYFDLRMNSLMIRAAEQYFRMTFEGKAEDIWNNREQLMLETVNAIIDQQKKQKQTAKVIIWAHNSHAGDARATGMKEVSKVSLGQLLRQQLGKQKVFLMGALSYQGKVMASEQWNGPASQMIMPAAVEGSYSWLFHQLGLAQFIMYLKPLIFTQPYQRFIGVVYIPEEEHLYHYNSAKINPQFDALLFVDKTTAVQPLDK